MKKPDRSQWQIKFFFILRPVFFYILLQTSSFLAVGQKYYFDTYGVEQGLTSSKVYFILQDRNDYIWLGTEGGAYRFDGKQFINFTPEEGMADDGVMTICETKDGKIWFGHLDGGISVYNGRIFNEIHLDSIEIKGDITSIREAGEHSLWVGTTGSGLLKISNLIPPYKAITVKQYKGSEGLSDQIFNITQTKRGDFFCITAVGIRKYNRKKDRFENFTLPGLTTYWMKTCMFEDSVGNYWIGTYNGGLYKYDRKADSMQIYDKRDGLANNWITFITDDNFGNVWVGTFGGGISVYTSKGIKNYSTDNGLPDNFVKHIMEDREGNILIGTQDQGLCIYKGDQFMTLGREAGLLNANVWAIHKYQDKYWFGTNEGIAIFDPSKKNRNHFRFFNLDNSTIPNKIRSLKEDKDQNIWIGTDGGGLLKYLNNTKRFIYDSYLNRNLYRDGIITALEIDNNNQVWIGTHDGLGLWNIKKHDGRRFSQINGLAGNRITALYCDKIGNLWIGSDGKKGLTKYDPTDQSFTIVKLGVRIAPTSITEDSQGKIWLGTSRGVYAWNGDSLTFHLTEKNGLLTNMVKLLVVDNADKVYIGTNKGLNCFDQSTGKMNAYTRKNGFVGIETHDNAVYKDGEETIWFGTAKGVTRLDPAKFRNRPIEPLTHIGRMQVNYQVRDMVPGMRLNHTERSIVFDYYSICITNPDVVQYQVKLAGADPNWQPVTQQTEAIYSTLAPKKYTFMVKARNSDGVWNKEPVEFQFTILPPIYERWWFILIMLILIGVIIVAYIKIREKALRKENKILEDKVQSRTAEVIQKSLVIEQKNKDITDSIRYAKRIQNAILPPEDSLKDTFILFKPKDIVSGDFYWLSVEGSIQFLSAVDCTGHGVPGAFMSIIGYNSLNKIVKEYQITQPADILNHLNDEIVRTLQKQAEDGEVKDGMDLALIVYDMENRKLQYAGAHNPLYLIRNNELIETKADRFAIGRTSSESERKFTNHSMQMQPEDVIYIFSDGFADQFGGPEGKKFKVGALKKLLMEVHSLPMEEQKIQLEKTIEKWKGKLEQVDDILLIGTRF